MLGMNSGRIRKDTTWKTRVTITRAITETPAKAAISTGRIATLRIPRMIAAASALATKPDWISRPGVRKTAPRNERALTTRLMAIRRAREPLLGRQARITWICRR